MKTKKISLLAAVLISGIAFAQDTMNVYKIDGSVIRFATNLIDSVTFKVGGNSLPYIDGYLYPTITIGNQVWMSQNLNTTIYNDGTPIPSVMVPKEWAKLITPAMKWYSSDSSTYTLNKYGALYNWHAVNTGKLCPYGWHVPSDSEWSYMLDQLGGISLAGGKLKETGTLHWKTPNPASNSTGFTAFPGGYIGPDGASYDGGSYGRWWSSSPTSGGKAWQRHLNYSDVTVVRISYPYEAALSVRCVRD